MSDIKISRRVFDDLFKGKASYIKKKRLFYDQIIFDKKELTFKHKRKALATLKLPEVISFDSGDTVTINFTGSMDIHFD